MKTSVISTLGLLAFPVAALANQVTIPTGNLNVSARIVRADTSVNLDWKVEFPPISEVEALVEVDPNGSIRTKKRVNVEVRNLGSDYSNGRDYGYVSSRIKFGSSYSWETLFDGWHFQVDPSAVLQEQIVEPNDELSFYFRGTTNGFTWISPWDYTWHAPRRTGTGDQGILILKNGDSIPAIAPSYNQDSVATFLAPYTHADGTVNIGPRDLIILVDVDSRLGQTSGQAPDFQDFVILATFTEERD